MTTDQGGNPHVLDRERRAELDVSELLGLTRGIIADGCVSRAEAETLRRWVESHPEAAGHWPLPPLIERLELIFHDGVVEDVERDDLAELLRSICEGNAHVLDTEGTAAALPLNVPPPEIEWQGSRFVLVGRFAVGTPDACQDAVRRRGGVCENDVTRETHYVVVGTFGSRDWTHTSFGRKIQRAANYRDNGAPLAIVSERHWAACMRRQPL